MKTAAKERIEEGERLALRNKVKEEERVGSYGVLREDIGMKTYLFTRSNGLREINETAISCGGPGPTGKEKEIYP